MTYLIIVFLVESMILKNNLSMLYVFSQIFGTIFRCHKRFILYLKELLHKSENCVHNNLLLKCLLQKDIKTNILVYTKEF